MAGVFDDMKQPKHGKARKRGRATARLCRELGVPRKSVKSAKLADLKPVSALPTHQIERLERQLKTAKIADLKPKKRQMKPPEKASNEAFGPRLPKDWLHPKKRQVTLPESLRDVKPLWDDPNPAPAKRTSVARFGKSDWAGCGDHDNEKA